jgi:thioesterase domain-containing protein
MLVPYKTTGTRPPFFLVHGLFGVTPEHLTPDGFESDDRPGYFLVARGFDGSAPPCESVRELASLYVREIVRAHPGGPYLVGGSCDGSRVAIEVARELMASGRQVGPVLLLDPSIVPHQTPAALARLELELQKPAMRQQMTDQARRSVRMLNQDLDQKLFDSADPAQLEIATKVGAATALALLRHVLTPFFGEVEMVLSAQRAPRFFDPGQ